jgi:hypothetical protein
MCINTYCKHLIIDLTNKAPCGLEMTLTTRLTRKYPQQNQKLRLPQNHQK